MISSRTYQSRRVTASGLSALMLTTAIASAHRTVRRLLGRIGIAVAVLGLFLGATTGYAQEHTILDAATIVTSVRAGQRGVLALTVAPDAYDTLSAAKSVSLTGLDLSPALRVDLELERFWAWGPGTQFVMGTDQGDVPMSAPAAVFFRGVVIGDPQSQVFLSASPSGLNAIIRVGQAQYFLSTAGAQDQRLHWLFDGLSPEAATPPVRFECKDDPPPGEGPTTAHASHGAELVVVSRVALIAVDADFEMRQLFVTPNDAALYVCELMAAISVFYETEVGMKLALSYVRIWDTPADPYTAPDSQTQLDQLKSYWEANMNSVPRNDVHLMSGRDLGGGRASRGQMCGGADSYGVSGNMSGSFPRPPQNGNDGNWDLMVVAHELGHNFGSPHTHCYSPPVDICYTQEDGCASGTSVCQQGTIMSYCHTCGNGMANIDLTFGPTVAGHIQSQLLACIGTARNPCFVNGAFTGTQQGTSSNPYRTIARGTWYVAPGGIVSIAPGTYTETMIIAQPMRLTTTGGLVAIGR